jgi:hypothetical protein
MGVLSMRNGNWHGVMQQIWNMMQLDIRQYLRRPRKTEALAAYMREIAESKSNFIASATERYPFERNRALAARAPEYERSSGYGRRDDRRDDRRGQDYRQNGRYRQNDRRDDRRVRFEDWAFAFHLLTPNGLRITADVSQELLPSLYRRHHHLL